MNVKVKVYPRRKVSGGAEVSAEHGQTKCSEEEDEREEEDIREVVRVAAVAFEKPFPVPAVFGQQAAGSDEHLVLSSVAVVIQPSPVAAKRHVEPGLQISSEIFVPVVRAVADLERPVHFCDKNRLISFVDLFHSSI